MAPIVIATVETHEGPTAAPMLKAPPNANSATTMRRMPEAAAVPTPRYALYLRSATMAARASAPPLGRPSDAVSCWKNASATSWWPDHSQGLNSSKLTCLPGCSSLRIKFFMEVLPIPQAP